MCLVILNISDYAIGFQHNYPGENCLPNPTLTQTLTLIFLWGNCPDRKIVRTPCNSINGNNM